MATAVAFVVSLVAGLAAVPSAAEVGTDGWDRRPFRVTGEAQPIVGNFGGDEAADVLWYRPGSATDAIWYGKVGARGQSRMVKRTVRVSGDYQPIVGDFEGADGYDEILWYAPGSTRDYLWTSLPDTYDFGVRSHLRPIGGDFTWAVLHDFRGGKDDIAWIARGDARDYIWHFKDDGSGFPLNVTVSAPASDELVAGDYDGNGYDDLVLHRPGPQPDELWRSSPQGTVSRTIFELERSFDLVTIRQEGGDDLLLRPRAAGTIYDIVWEHGSPPFAASTVIPKYPQGRPSGAITFDAGRALLYGRTTADYLLRYTNHGELQAFSEQLPLTDPHAGDFDGDGQLDIVWSRSSFWYAPAA
jgi:hypothetical protein